MHRQVPRVAPRIEVGEFEVLDRVDNPAETVDLVRIKRPLHNAIKRTLDILLASAILAVIAPVLVLIALLVWREDGAPIIYFHRRIGKNGKAFNCLKFRTMVHDSEAILQRALALDLDLRREWEQNFKLENDPRILGSIGLLLRRSSLDELPQLFNVLRGDMSLVGPRPIIDDELPKYGRFKNHYLSVKPGITGPWQVGGRSDTTYEERVRLDAWYAANAATSTDMSILFRTITAFVTGQLGGGR
ncbi:sugar transferase [Mangrovicoccus sp. HB161399]|uniref:sugar transferase n=1 Tax=Mangrovicoccus sp. HB161399 TaxID=2720392 RepID=UPI0015542FAA|nr:sugar transferase [Mangrovicoccus sp. HB161399]